jgi:hypothetical protein
MAGLIAGRYLYAHAITRDRTGSAWAWLSFALALALTIPLIWRAWIIIGPSTYNRSSTQRGKMLFERRTISVQAESRGHSLLLIPVQYSHCLVPSEVVKTRLLAADLVQAAVLFQGNIELRIYFE